MKILKIIIIIVITIISLISISVIPCIAHPGRTDSYGGHYNYDTGDYHYHHGYSEHYHNNGVCPYESTTATFDFDKLWEEAKRYNEERDGANATTKSEITTQYRTSPNIIIPETTTKQQTTVADKKNISASDILSTAGKIILVLLFVPLIIYMLIYIIMLLSLIASKVCFFIKDLISLIKTIIKK